MLALKTIGGLTVQFCFLKTTLWPRSEQANIVKSLVLVFVKDFFLPIKYMQRIKEVKAAPVVLLSHKEQGLLRLLEVDGSVYSLYVPREPKVINCPRRTLHLESSSDPVVRTWKQRLESTAVL